MSAQPATSAPATAGSAIEFPWSATAARAPQLAATMIGYLDQLAVSARPGTVSAYDIALRQFAACVVEGDPTCRRVAAIERRHIEHYKVWLKQRCRSDGRRLSTKTIRHRLGLVRVFFERIIEWGYDDAPARVPIYPGDLPEVDEPLPKFLDDATAAKFMAALATETSPARRLLVELLARTGMRVSEAGGLDDDAVVRIGDTHWLRVPVGKLHNDRYVPLHPILVELIDTYRRQRGPSATGKLLERADGRPVDRRTAYRWVQAVARRAGIGPVHPHQLRHTLATQAINRGMSLEAIAALLGHRSMRMTLTYARITDRTVADEYFRVTAAVEATYDQPAVELLDGTAGANMRRVAADHRRLLGNGHCTRPVALDCQFETICERCGFYETGPEFVPVLVRQRDHAARNNQPARAQIYNDLLDGLDDAT
jgi:integrase